MTSPRFGFPRSCRLRTAAEFQRVFDAAVKSADQYFTVLARPNECGRARLGLAISKKGIRKAADRNRTKRVIRESFRRYQHQLDALDLVVIARSASARADSPTIRLSIDRHWQVLLQRCVLCSSASSKPINS